MTTEPKPLTGTALAAAAAMEVMPGKYVHIAAVNPHQLGKPQHADEVYVIVGLTVDGPIHEVYRVEGKELVPWRPERDITAAMEVLERMRTNEMLTYRAKFCVLLHSVAVGKFHFVLFDMPIKDICMTITQAALKAVRRAKGAKP